VVETAIANVETTCAGECWKSTQVYGEFENGLYVYREKAKSLTRNSIDARQHRQRSVEQLKSRKIQVCTASFSIEAKSPTLRAKLHPQRSLQNVQHADAQNAARLVAECELRSIVSRPASRAACTRYLRTLSRRMQNQLRTFENPWRRGGGKLQTEFVSSLRLGFDVTS
jgi:hypothetical protein